MPGGEREDERCKQIHKTNKIEILTINLNRCRMPQDLGVHKTPKQKGHVHVAP